MAVPVWTVGQVLLASDVNTWLVPQVLYKAAATSRSSTTVLAGDPDLTTPVVGGAVYDVELSLLYNGGTTNASDLKFSWLVPSGSTFGGGFVGITNPLGVYIIPVTATSTQVSYSNGTGSPLWCMVSGTLFTSISAGSLTLTWAQNTSNGTATTLMAGCKMHVQRAG